MLTARCATGFRGYLLLSRPVPSGPRAGRVSFVDLVAKRTWILSSDHSSTCFQAVWLFAGRVL